MPSWGDGESSSPSILGDCVESDYAPETCADRTFEGIAVGCPELCRVHRLEPHKCVAFEGTNTGRRFYMCQVQNCMANCGFVSWVDDQEWPQTMKNALNRLWAMYYDENNARIDDRVQSSGLVKQLSDEKNKIEKNYQSLLNDVKKFMEETEKKMVEGNYKKIRAGAADVVSIQDVKEVEKERDLLKTEVAKLRSGLKELKQIHKSQAEVMKEKQLRWEGERDSLKEEKKKLEYMLYDMFKASDSLKEKVRKIRDICDV